MRKQNNIRVLELLKYLYLRTDEEHPATIADMLDYLKGKGLQAVRQTVYGDLQDLMPKQRRCIATLFTSKR